MIILKRYYEKRWQEMEGRRFFGQGASFEEAEPLLKTVKKISETHGATMGQVAIAWVVAKGCVPIAGCKNESQMRENAAAMNVKLTPEEISELDAVSIKGTVNFWQGKSA